MAFQNTMTANALPILERKIGDFNVDSITTAPLQIEVALNLKVSQEKAFQLVFVHIASWFKEIDGIIWNNSKSSMGASSPGLHSSRECGFDGKKLYENIVLYKPPHAYGYVIDMEKSTASFPVKDPLGVFLVKSVGENESTIIWRQYFNKKFHPAALIIKPMVKNMMMKKNLKTLIKKYGGQFSA
jgi:hypothetical protein